MEELYKKLYSYHDKDIYPFHMPGHKRNSAFEAGFLPVKQDITEISGFDDLHHAEDIIKNAQDSAAELFGSKEVFFSVNGSTAAILSAVSAAVKRGGKLLTARNCHKSLYHAMYLREIVPVYIYPGTDRETGICRSIDPEEADRLLDENPDIEAVFITSPTYDGVVSDIRAIAEAAHRHSVPLIVDEAHGAHFCFSSYFPESAIKRGADIVIHSIHKTLPSMTGTSVLHICTDRISRDRIAWFMSVYQTSSPSYPLMASMDYCFHFLRNHGNEWFDTFTSGLEELRRGLSRFQKIRLMDFCGAEYGEGRGFFDFDRSKILLSADRVKDGGTGLFGILREKYLLEPEMAAYNYVLLITSVGDTEEGFRRLYEAVSDLENSPEGLISGKSDDISVKKTVIAGMTFERPETVMRISEAMDSGKAALPLDSCVGKISAEFMYLYPPGVPLIVPGERISLQFVRNMRRYMSAGMKIAGIRDSSGKYMDCVV